jgi:hypothetical protein
VLANKAIFGNFNLYWLFGASLSLWFTLFKGVGYVHRTLTDGTNLSVPIHVLLSMLISWVCIWNLLHSPSHGPAFRIVHVGLGRFGLVVSVFAAILGFTTVWHYKYGGVTGFSVGISIGGTLQLFCTVRGFFAIRRYKAMGGPPPLSGYDKIDDDIRAAYDKERARLLNIHITSMVALFFGGCLIPALMRLPFTWLDSRWSWTIGLALGLGFIWAFKGERRIL